MGCPCTLPHLLHPPFRSALNSSWRMTALTEPAGSVLQGSCSCLSSSICSLSACPALASLQSAGISPGINLAVSLKNMLKFMLEDQCNPQSE